MANHKSKKGKKPIHSYEITDGRFRKSLFNRIKDRITAAQLVNEAKVHGFWSEPVKPEPVKSENIQNNYSPSTPASPVQQAQVSQSQNPQVVKWPPKLTSYAQVAPLIRTYAGGTPKDFPYRLHETYTYLNDKLFQNRLEPVSMKIENLKGVHAEVTDAIGLAGGRKDDVPQLILMGNKQVPVEEGKHYRNISLDFTYLGSSAFQDVLSTLVHEMCHIDVFASGGENGPHGPLWVSTMYQIGLIPTSTGNIGGEQSGVSVSDYIEKDGVFDCVTRQLIAEWDNLSTFDDEDFD